MSMGTFGDKQGDTLVTSIQLFSHLRRFKGHVSNKLTHCKHLGTLVSSKHTNCMHMVFFQGLFGNKQAHWTNPNKDYHKLNLGHSSTDGIKAFGGLMHP